jgi:hypothetical protein
MSSRAVARLSVESSCAWVSCASAFCSASEISASFAAMAGSIELGDHVPFLDDGAFGNERRDLGLPDLGLLHVQRALDLHELLGAQLARDGHHDVEVTLLHARDHGGIVLRACRSEVPGRDAVAAAMMASRATQRLRGIRIMGGSTARSS